MFLPRLSHSLPRLFHLFFHNQDFPIYPNPAHYPKAFSFVIFTWHFPVPPTFFFLFFFFWLVGLTPAPPSPFPDFRKNLYTAPSSAAHVAGTEALRTANIAANPISITTADLQRQGSANGANWQSGLSTEGHIPHLLCKLLTPYGLQGPRPPGYSHVNV